MDEQSTTGPGALRRAVLRVLPTPVDVVPDEQLWVQDAPPLHEVIDDLPEPRIADLEALLRDVDRLRATLRQDLSLAATALDADEPALAAWLLNGQDDLPAFERSALGHLDALADRDVAAGEAPPEVEPDVPLPLAAGAGRHRRFLSAAPFAAAAAVVFAFVAGVASPPTVERTVDPRIDNAALASYEEFTQLALEGGSVSEISAAAERFHDDLAPLVASPLTDPAAVTHAIWLLQSERALLIAGGDSSRELSGVLREADRLVARLQAGLSRARARAAVPVGELLPAEDRQERDKPAPSKQQSSPRPAPAKQSAAPKPSPTPTATAAPKPSPTPAPTSQPSPSPTGQPTPKPTDSGEPTAPPTVLPKAPPPL